MTVLFDPLTYILQDHGVDSSRRAETYLEHQKRFKDSGHSIDPKDVTAIIAGFTVYQATPSEYVSIDDQLLWRQFMMDELSIRIAEIFDKTEADGQRPLFVKAFTNYANYALALLKDPTYEEYLAHTAYVASEGISSLWAIPRKLRYDIDKRSDELIAMAGAAGHYARKFVKTNKQVDTPTHTD